jgi:hypothetical protein
MKKKFLSKLIYLINKSYFQKVKEESYAKPGTIAN